MTESHSAVISRLSSEFAAMSEQMAKVSAELTALDGVLTTVVGPTEKSAAQPAPAPPPVHQAPVPQGYAAQPQQVHAAPAYWQQYYYPQGAPSGGWPTPGWQQPQYAAQQVAHPAPRTPPAPPVHNPPPYAPPPVRPPEPRPSDGGWIGKVLAIAGVAVTLIGVVLLVVLAAQAGILRPEVRVLAGAALAAALVGVALWLYTRPGGRVGAVALAATGVAAAYIDVIAITNIYAWVSAAVGLLVAALIAGGGLLLARRWDSQQLGLLVLVPLIVLAPVVTDGITMLLVGFMLALAVGTLPVQLGKNWIWLHVARVAAPTLPLLLATLFKHFGSDTDAWLLGGASAIAALLAIIGALVLLPWTSGRAAMALITAAGTLPVLAAPAALPGVGSGVLCAALSLCLLAIVLVADRLPGVSGIVAHVWSALAAVSALIAVVAAFDGYVASPVLLAMAITLAVAGRRSDVSRWAAIAFGAFGGLFFLGYAPPSALVDAAETSGAHGASILITGVLLAATAVVIAWSWAARGAADSEVVKSLWALAAAVIVYAVTTFTVTAGVLIGGVDGGFLGGHMAATICWIALAAALFGYAARRPRDDRSLPIAGGLALTVFAMAKLFLFDLGTLSGIFRVVVFIVVGLVLLGMGAGYARLLAQQDQAQRDGAVDAPERMTAPMVTDETSRP